MSTLTVNPSGYDANKSSWLSVTSLDNCYNDTSNETYAQFYLQKGGMAQTSIYLTFDLSSIPSDATITSVNCKAKCRISTDVAARILTRQVQMFSGSTAKGSADTISTQTETLILDVGSWNRQELDDLSLRFYAERNYSGTSNNQYLYVYGADLTIEYTAGGSTETLKIKSNGNWEDISKVYLKENGSWVEQTTGLSALFNTEANYVKSN